MGQLIKGTVDISELMTKAEYAKRTGFSKAWVTQLAQQGRLETVKVKGGVLIRVPRDNEFYHK